MPFFGAWRFSRQSTPRSDELGPSALKLLCCFSVAVVVVMKNRVSDDLFTSVDARRWESVLMSDCEPMQKNLQRLVVKSSVLCMFSM